MDSVYKTSSSEQDAVVHLYRSGPMADSKLKIRPQTADHQRLILDDWTATTTPNVPGQDLYASLSGTPRTVPAKYFYDARGSALFEQICDLPEYYLTRTETAIFQAHADDLAALTGPCQIIELGSGSSTKTRILLDAYQRLQRPLHYCPIDISPSILEHSAHALLQDYPHLSVHGLISTYDTALDKLAEIPQLDAQANRMICFIGSSLGNFAPSACDVFLDRIAQALPQGSWFLLGIDLHKSASILEAAYDDAQGVTAAFNLNLLDHLNHRFGANFDRQQFKHKAIYNTQAQQIEMHLYSLIDQTIDIPTIGLNFTIAQGETILSEISRKFDLTAMQQLLNQKNLPVKQIWTDPQQWFSVLLCKRQD
jgi:L-histidine Nalpha-methyltransferase